MTSFSKYGFRYSKKSLRLQNADTVKAICFLQPRRNFSSLAPIVYRLADIFNYVEVFQTIKSLFQSSSTVLVTFPNLPIFHCIAGKVHIKDHIVQVVCLALTFKSMMLSRQVYVHQARVLSKQL